MEYTYSGFVNRASAEHLQQGETCKITGIGNSMTPILASKQPVICEPVTEETELKKKDIVLCKVKGHYYLHLIHSIKPNKKGPHSYLIGNNHGRMNGWIGRSQIFGIVRAIL